MFAAHRLRENHVKKLVVIGASAVAASTIGLLSAGLAGSDPNQLNVIGEPYYKAVKILHGMGVSTAPGTTIGGPLPQQQCMVASQQATNSKMILHLDCTQKAAELMAEEASSAPGGVPGGRQVGANGVTTVQATPVGPQPGMSVPGG
jgi:hypothetical protein